MKTHPIGTLLRRCGERLIGAGSLLDFRYESVPSATKPAIFRVIDHSLVGLPWSIVDEFGPNTAKRFREEQIRDGALAVEVLEENEATFTRGSRILLAPEFVRRCEVVS